MHQQSATSNYKQLLQSNAYALKDDNKKDVIIGAEIDLYLSDENIFQAMMKYENPIENLIYYYF